MPPPLVDIEQLETIGCNLWTRTYISSYHSVHSSGVARIWRWWHRGSGERKSPSGVQGTAPGGWFGGDIVSRKLIAVIKDIWLPNHAQFCVFHSTAQPEIFLWTQFRGGGRAPRPSFPLAAPLVHTDYLLKLLRRQGLPDAQLSVIANAVIISRLLYRYALPAWGGFLSVKLINRINAFLRRMQRFGYFQCGITVAELISVIMICSVSYVHQRML